MSDLGPVPVEALIVSYQTRELLHQTLTTLLANPPAPARATLSVAVLDNASDDRSADMVANEFPAVRLIRSDRNLGFAAANNALARSSRASYLLLLNSDVIVIEDLVGPLLEALRSDQQAAVAGPRLTGADGAPQYSSQQFPSLRLELAQTLHQTRIGKAIRFLFDPAQVIAESRQVELAGSREPRRTSFLWATCWLIAREEITRHGLFDERYVTYDEDLDFCRRLRQRGRAALFVPGVHLIHLGGSSSSFAGKTMMRRNGRLRYYRDHQGRRSEVLYRFGIGALVDLKGLKQR